VTAAYELVGWGYVVLLVDSFATRDIEHACMGGFTDIAGMRRSDAYGALTYLLARPSSTRNVWPQSASRKVVGSPS
jgi:hypothetical protein